MISIKETMVVFDDLFKKLKKIVIQFLYLVIHQQHLSFVVCYVRVDLYTARIGRLNANRHRLNRVLGT